MYSQIPTWIIVAACLFVSTEPLIAQAPLPPCLSGIINSYTPVIGFGCDSSSLQVGGTVGFVDGDKVLLVQMQVPQVDLSNTASFGDALNLTCIGNYEFNRILSVAGSSVQLKYNLVRPYDVTGKVQLIRVPEFDTASVCNLSCLPWNGNIGGVLALDVKTVLTLQGNIDVSGAGFRGGGVEPNSIPWVFGEQEYFYPPVTTLAAAKGEGIVYIPTDHSFGRGRAGNGGGGGNAHNGGGGGGANAGSGGDGGLEITIPPAAPTPNTNGIGGAKYFDTNANKALLGGGGGAGHANDALGSSGGVGGGMVFLLANTINTNNFRILANGVDVFGGAEQNDGQGGGGGGGTILLSTQQVNGVLNCELKGGRGGSNPYTPAFQVHGPGGGGGGGKLLVVQNSPNIVAALQGGVNGLSSQNVTNGAMPGAVGVKLTGFSLAESNALSHPVSTNLELVAQSPLCNGMANGQISILHSTALSFQLNNGGWQPDSIFSNLVPGTYQISLQFSGGCTLDTSAVLVPAPPTLDSLLWRTDATCIEGGSIAVAAVSGLAPFEFQLNGEPWQADGTFYDLVPGAYSITLRDAAGCTDSDTYDIAAPPPVQESLQSLLTATCIAGGEITVQAIGGTAPFTYQLDGGAWQANGVFSNLSPGIYTLAVQDSAGCMASNTYTVAASPAVADSLLSLAHATCLLGGSLVVEAISGTAPYSFQLGGGAWQPNGAFSGIPPGAYALLVRDAAGCTASNTYTIETPPTLADSLLLQIGATCVAGGSLSIEAVSGSSPFEYQLNGGAWQGNGTFDDLVPGNYSIVVRDDAGCTETGTYVITAPEMLTDSLLVLVNATCVEGGIISVVAVSGTPPFSYQLNGGAWQTDGAFNNLVPGDYWVGMLDAAGCALTLPYTIVAPPPVELNLLGLIDATCVMGGTVMVGAVSGTAPYVFQLNGGNGQPQGVFSSLIPGNYTVTLRDAAGCTDTATYAIAAPAQVTYSLLNQTNATCVLGGVLEVEAVSGTPPYEFQLNGNSWQSSGIFANLVPGNYVVSLRDGSGCMVSHTYAIMAPPPVASSLLSLTNATCVDGGSIVVQALAGTMPYEYQLNGSAWQASGDFISLPPGNYTVTLRDAAGCTVTSQYGIAAPPPVMDSLLLLSAPGCDALGTLSVEAISGTPPFQFQLDNGAWQPSGYFDQLDGGEYAIALRDGAGCTISSVYMMATYKPLQLTLDSFGVVDCRHELGYIAVAASGGQGVYSYMLENSPIVQTTGYFSALVSGVYDIIVTDEDGCETRLNNLALPNMIDSALTFQKDTIYEGSWYLLPDGRQTGRPGQYPFHYLTTEGCDSLHLIDLIVLKRHVYVPNVFSPNEDGQDDYFTIYSDASLQIVDLLQVYDRWGELIFEKKDFVPNKEENGWDGIFRSRPVNPGVFVWRAELTFVDGFRSSLSGDVTVVR